MVKKLCTGQGNPDAGEQSTVFLLINTPGRDAKHNEGASILTLKQQNTVTKKTPFFSSKYVDCHIFLPIFKARLLPGIILI